MSASSWTLTGAVTLETGSNAIKFELANKLSPQKDEDIDSGYGTVPCASGASIAKAVGAQCVFRMKGFDHQGSYANRDVIENVMCCIGKIIQQAIPAKELQSNTEEGTPSCSDKDGNSGPSPLQSSPASVYLLLTPRSLR